MSSVPSNESDTQKKQLSIKKILYVQKNFSDGVAQTLRVVHDWEDGRETRDKTFQTRLCGTIITVNEVRTNIYMETLV